MTFDIPDDESAVVISFEDVRHEWERKRAGQTCGHHRIYVDPREITVTCRDCNERLATNAWVLEHLAAWRMAKSRLDRIIEERKKLEGRERVRCQHCNKITGTTRDVRLQIVREATTDVIDLPGKERTP